MQATFGRFMHTRLVLGRKQMLTALEKYLEQRLLSMTCDTRYDIVMIRKRYQIVGHLRPAST